MFKNISWTAVLEYLIRTVQELFPKNSSWIVIEQFSKMGHLTFKNFLELFVEPAVPEVFLTMSIIEQFKFKWSYPPQ